MIVCTTYTSFFLYTAQRSSVGTRQTVPVLYRYRPEMLPYFFRSSLYLLVYRQGCFVCCTEPPASSFTWLFEPCIHGKVSCNQYLKIRNLDPEAISLQNLHLIHQSEEFFLGMYVQLGKWKLTYPFTKFWVHVFTGNPKMLPKLTIEKMYDPIIYLKSDLKRGHSFREGWKCDPFPRHIPNWVTPQWLTSNESISRATTHIIRKDRDSGPTTSDYQLRSYLRLADYPLVIFLKLKM